MKRGMVPGKDKGQNSVAGHPKPGLEEIFEDHNFAGSGLRNNLSARCTSNSFMKTILLLVKLGKSVLPKVKSRLKLCLR